MSLLLMGVGGASGSGPLPPVTLTKLLWLDASDAATRFQDSGLTTPAVANLAPVGGWTDKSGLGSNVLNALADGRKPKLLLAAQNGLPVLSASTSEAQFLESAATVPAAAQPLTIFMAARFTDLSPTNRAFDTTNRVLGGTDSGPVYQAYAGGGVLTGGTPDTSFHTFSWDYQNGPFVLKVDGATALTGTAGTAAWGTQVVLFNDFTHGFTPAASMWLGEMIVASSVSAGDFALTVAYLKSKWGTP